MQKIKVMYLEPTTKERNSKVKNRRLENELKGSVSVEEYKEKLKEIVARHYAEIQS